MPDAPEMVTVDFDSLTIDEIDLVEETCDADLEDIQAGKVRKGKVLRAFALVALRRTDPDATAADAGRVTVEGLGELLGERPTGAAGPPATSNSHGSSKRRASRSSGSRG
jgi:hypothetical protein